MISTAHSTETQLERLFDAASGSERFDAGLEHLCPDVELDLSELIDGRVHRGRDSVCAYLDSLHADVWSELTMEREEVAEGHGVVVALVRCRAVGRASGVPVETRAAWVATLDHGRIKTARFTLDRERALEAAGVPA
ncbi:MAG TPA: nuclear transport factor 2 family protein [Thermoleophilaceae bacterium]|nr:nuclear transport factor 2 family protein [Thermoleophilaceae bacterium]